MNKLSIKAPMFEEALKCIDLTLANTLQNMIEKNVEDGTVSLKIKISLDRKTATYVTEEGLVATDSIVLPAIEWKVGSAMKLELKTDGDLPLLNQALRFSTLTNEFELYDCSDQLSIF